MIKTVNIPCRDPFILPFDGRYYLYRSMGERGIECLVSEDLENWAEPVTVYTPPADYGASADYFWAPECHRYGGYFYIFTSVRRADCGHHVISAYRAEHPLGPFADIAGGLTDPAWDAIDGTLYVDREGAPWLVFVHEWTSMPDKVGTMEAARLSEDMTHFVSPPVTLFRADEPAWAVLGVTDGPCVYTASDGALFMTWSNFSKEGYVVALARSVTGLITGPWVHEEQPLYEKGRRPRWEYDGGHATVFRDNAGDAHIVFHRCNTPTETVRERVAIEDIVEEGDTLRIR